MVEKFYSPQELRGALVYDSEGLLHGEIDGVEFSDNVYLVVVIRRKVGELVVDEPGLKAALESRGKLLSDEMTLEELVALAKEAGVKVPRIVAGKELVLTKSKIPVGEVRWIDSKHVDVPGLSGEVRVVLLRTPREANYRGSAGMERPPSPQPEELEGKLLLSLSRGILGVIGEVTVGFGAPGLRAFLKRSRDREVLWISYLRALRRLGLTSLVDRLYEYADPYKFPRLPGEKLREVREILREANAPEEAYRLLDEHIKILGGERVYIDIPWPSVIKVGDAVICE